MASRPAPRPLTTLPLAESDPTVELEPGAFRALVLATDGEAHSERAYSVAAALARAFEARLHVLVVAPIHGEFEFASTPWAPAPTIPEIDEEKRNYRAITAGVSGRAQQEGVRSVTSEMLIGQPAPTILSASEETGADLVVLGSCRTSSSHRIFLGSVSNAVASVSSLPVLIARGAAAKGADGGERTFDRVIAAVDGSRAATEALRHAIAISRRLEIPLTIVTVVPHLVGHALRSSGAQRREAHALESAETLLAEGRGAASRGGIEDAATKLLRGTPAEAILEYSGPSESPLLIVGSRGLSPTRGLFLGSVSAALLHHAPASVLIVRLPK